MTAPHTTPAADLRPSAVARVNGFGARLEALRVARGMSQCQLAKRTGIAEASISRYVNHGMSPDAWCVVALADVLGCSADYLLGRHEFAPAVVAVPNGSDASRGQHSAGADVVPRLRDRPSGRKRPRASMSVSDAEVDVMAHVVDLLLKGRSAAHLGEAHRAELQGWLGKVSRAQVTIAKQEESALSMTAHAATVAHPPSADEASVAAADSCGRAT